MNEAFLYYVWTYYLKGLGLKTTSDQSLIIQKTGVKNENSGPDFFNAHVWIDDVLWAGNVEIHQKSSDWFKHKHQYDEAYGNVILHVVYECDVPVYRTDGFEIPCLELKNNINGGLYEKYQSFLTSKNWISCAADINKVDYFSLYSWFQRLAFERLEQKAEAIRRLLVQNNGDFQEVFYRTLMRGYGFKVNSDAFEQLAHALPYQILLKHKNDLLQLEALLFGQAGLIPQRSNDSYVIQMKAEYHFLSVKYNLKSLSPKIWRFMRMRPSNFPTLRIAQIAILIFRTSGLLNSVLTAGEMKMVYDLFTARTSSFWSTHYTFNKSHKFHPKKMGDESIYSLLINTIIPFVFVYGHEFNDDKMKDKALDWLSQIPAESNMVIRNFNKLGIQVQHAAQSQGLLQLKTKYCDQKRCLNCSVGHYLIKESVS
ncbi:MAG: DUF2851 family protein [Bacteroidales bacterium]|nr:DUF2851 family protein [Bacteroidales bacterium]